MRKINTIDFFLFLRIEVQFLHSLELMYLLPNFPEVNLGFTLSFFVFQNCVLKRRGDKR